MAGREQNILLRANVQRKNRSEVRCQIAEVKRGSLLPLQSDLCNLTSAICNTVLHAARSDWTCDGRCCWCGWLPVHGSDRAMVWTDVCLGNSRQQATRADVRG